MPPWQTILQRLVKDLKLTVGVRLDEDLLGVLDAWNGTQIFLKSVSVGAGGTETWSSYYGTWHNAHPGPQTMVLNVSTDPPAYVDPDFDASQVALLGVKLGTNTAATGEWHGWMDVAHVSIEYADGTVSEYAFENIEDAITRLAATEANTVALVDHWFVDSLTAAEIHPDERVTQQYPGSPTAAIEETIERFHAEGLAVHIKPHLDMTGFNYAPGEWRGIIRPPDGDIPAFFESYEDFIGFYADIAERTGAEGLVVETELVSLDTDPTLRSHWEDVVDSLRGIYSGDLIVAANWDSYQDHKFVDLVDVVGIDAYFPLTDAPDPTMEELKAAWRDCQAPGYEGRDWVGEIEEWSATLQETLGKPFYFTEIGIQSRDGAAVAPGSVCEDGTTQFNKGLQVAYYEATQEVFSENGNFAGLLGWNWFPWSDAGGVGDIDFTPQNKQLEYEAPRLFGPKDLGAIDFQVLSNLNLSPGVRRYSLTTTRAGLLSVEAVTDAAPEDVMITLLDPAGNQLATSAVTYGNPRLDWEVAAGQSFRLDLSGAATDVDVRVANLVELSPDGTHMTVYGHDGDDTLHVFAEPPMVVFVNGIQYEPPGLATLHAYSIAGGSNMAHLYGSEGIEHLEAKDEPESDWVRMSNQIDGWSSKAVDFDTVHAHASAGKDTADIDPEMLDSQLVLDLVRWDGQGDGNWGDFADGHSRWLSAQDDPLTFCPDSQFINVAVRTNTVTVAADCSACSLRVESGAVLVEADNTLAAAENVAVVAGAKYACELDAAGNGLIAAAGDVSLHDETTLELLVLESLGDPGCYTRTILSSAGEQGIDGDFQTKPAEGDYLDYGAFLRGYDISLVEYKLDLFQAGPGDFDGDGDVDLDDLSLLDDGWDPTATDKIWTEGDGDGDGDVDPDDLSILDDAWAPAGYPVVNCGEEGAAAGQVEGSDERSGHDAAVQEVFEQASDSRETSPGKWAWLYEFEQISTQSRPPQKHNQAAEAVDKLLAK